MFLGFTKKGRISGPTITIRRYPDGRTVEVLNINREEDPPPRRSPVPTWNTSNK